MSERVALLIQTDSGNTYAVICNSRDAADQIRESTPHEVIGVAPIVTRITAVLNGELK